MTDITWLKQYAALISEAEDIIYGDAPSDHGLELLKEARELREKNERQP